MESGVQADILVCRTEHELPEDLRGKLALFCNVREEAVIQAIDASTIYDVPNLMLEQGLDKVVLKKLNLESSIPDLTQWNQFLERHKNPKGEVCIIGVTTFHKRESALNLKGILTFYLVSKRSLFKNFSRMGLHD
jgi:CTP synthase